MRFNTKNLSHELSNRLGLYLLAAILAAVAFWFLLIKPTWNSAQATAAELADVRQEIHELEELDRATEELRANYAEIREQRDRIVNLLPPEEDEEKLLVLLSSYADQAGVVLGNFLPESGFITDGAAAGYGTYTASVNVVGRYQAVIGFVRALEEGARFVDITSVSFSASQTTPDTIGVGINMEAYYQTEEQLDEEFMEDEFMESEF